METATLSNNLHPDLDAHYIKNWLPNAADKIFKQLSNLPMQDEYLRMFGKTIRVPRQVLWVADESVNYTYAGQQHSPSTWTPELERLRKDLATYANFNSVLVNYYKDGHDYMGWHSDNEASLGPSPIIASLSLGAARSFKFRRKFDKQLVEIELVSGSLLLMHGNSQHEWQHMLPKRQRVNTARINLTFRNILD